MHELGDPLKMFAGHPVSIHPSRPVTTPIENLISNIFNQVEASSRNRLTVPHNIIVSDELLTIEVPIPGWGESDLEVRTENGAVTISAGMNESKDDNDNDNEDQEEYLVHRFIRSSFLIEVDVPSIFDPSSMKAYVQNGVLYVTVHRGVQYRPRQIAIGSAPVLSAPANDKLLDSQTDQG